MAVYVSYTASCDECGAWVLEAPRRSQTNAAARKAGFKRVRGEFLCPSCRTDVCGMAWRQEIGGWCLMKPNHEGPHDWAT